MRYQINAESLYIYFAEIDTFDPGLADLAFTREPEGQNQPGAAGAADARLAVLAGLFLAIPRSFLQMFANCKRAHFAKFCKF